jgi:glycosyltransferase involved in cell wall biosynthesis
MARLMIAALERAGCKVSLVSELRAYLPDAGDHDALVALEGNALHERRRIGADWRAGEKPDLWFCYHPYYKAPDLLGPDLAREFDLPWVSAEASLSRRRNQGIWAQSQTAVEAALAASRMNFAMTGRDRLGLQEHLPDLRIASLPPFLDLDIPRPRSALAGSRLVTVAMMRAGDKLASYRGLASALRLLPAGLDWDLAVAGDGPLRGDIEALFPSGRVRWLGSLAPEDVPTFLAQGVVYVWPGTGEAYGLAYLEAQAAGLPVVGWAAAGVPEVVADGETGLLSPAGDVAGLAADIARLLVDPVLRHHLGAAGRSRVQRRHGIDQAAKILDAGLKEALGER